jgi:hypothetical protein
MFHRGAAWRKWDLHVHTPASFKWRGEKLRKGDAAQEAKLYRATVEAMNASDIDAFGIMDYWTFDGFIGLRKFVSENTDVKLTKAVFPGMELRVDPRSTTGRPSTSRTRSASSPFFGEWGDREYH